VTPDVGELRHLRRYFGMPLLEAYAREDDSAYTCPAFPYGLNVVGQ
jgi:hypothetical protein